MAADDWSELSGGTLITDHLARHARKTPLTPALRFRGTERTYAQLDERVTRLANALRTRGIVPGDRVAVLCRNGLEPVEAFLASGRLGAICVPVNFRLVPAEIAYILRHSGSRALVVDADLAATAAAARASAPGVGIYLVVGADAGADAGTEAGAGTGTEAIGTLGAGAEPYEDAVLAASTEPPRVVVSRDDAAFIMYTSGTTGRPKGAVLTHDNILIHTFSVIAEIGITADDQRWLAGVPLFHIAGVAGIMPYLLLGRTSVIMPSGQFDAAEVVDVLERERISACFFVPTQWQAICSLPGVGERDLSALRRISWGAAPATPSVLEAMAETFPQASNQTSFGQTEMSPVTCLLRGEDAIRKRGSVGMPIFDVEIRIVDEFMRDVTPGEVGEIVYRGPTVMREYWNDPVATAESFAGGWFHSGDLVRQDEDGYLFVVDRKKDMIISGGENIYCAEIEDVVDGHPKVLEVALIGVPHPRWGETPLAVVAPVDPADPPTFAELDAWCRANLASYKVPRGLVVVDALPRNASGKVLKTRLRQDYGATQMLDGQVASAGPGPGPGPAAASRD